MVRNLGKHMDTKIFRVLVGLGVPGVALGIFYMLLKAFNFKFSEISPSYSALIAITFLIVVGSVTIFALHRWSPHSKDENAKGDSSHNPNPKNTELALMFNEEKVTFKEMMISLEVDVVKVYAHTHQVGIKAEYVWMGKRYPGFELLSQSLTTLKGFKENEGEKKIYFDIMEIRLANKRTKKIHFDISEFFDGIANSSMDKEEYITKKIFELYGLTK